MSVTISEEQIAALAILFDDERLSPAELIQLALSTMSEQDSIGLQSIYRWVRKGEEVIPGDEFLSGGEWAKAVQVGQVAGVALRYRRPILHRYKRDAAS